MLMKIDFIKALLILFLASSCHFKEDIYINEDGTGQIMAECVRDEGVFLQFQGDDYLQDEFVDSTYVVKNIIEQEKENFSRFLPEYQELLRKYEDVKVHIKKDSYTKEYRKSVSLSFNNINHVEDLSNVLDYIDDLQHNYPMKPEGKRTHLTYTFDGITFKRIFKVLNQANYDEYKTSIESAKQIINITNGSYTANYHFPRKIKSFSNPEAVLSADKKSLSLKMSFIDCLDKPETAFLEVVLEN